MINIYAGAVGYRLQAIGKDRTDDPAETVEVGLISFARSFVHVSASVKVDEQSSVVKIR